MQSLRAFLLRAAAVAVPCAALVLLGLGVRAVMASGIFTLARIEFRGNEHITDGKLKGLMGVREGASLWDVSLKDAAARLRTSPWVKKASVRKDYPRQIRVKVDEAVPLALLQTRDAISLIDKEGVVLEPYNGETTFLPVLVGDPRRDPAAWREAVALAGVVGRSGLATGRARVEIAGFEAGAENIALMIDGLVVKVGKGAYEEKLARFFSLQGEFEKLAIDEEYVDLRFANRVIVKSAQVAVQ
jgi:cell division protein FtsQ